MLYRLLTNHKDKEIQFLLLRAQNPERMIRQENVPTAVFGSRI